MTDTENYDYYNDTEEMLDEDGMGCCLKCPNAEPECLCYECCCRKCYWYEEGEHKGKCAYVHILKERKQQKYIKINGSSFIDYTKLKDMPQKRLD